MAFLRLMLQHARLGARFDSAGAIICCIRIARFIVSDQEGLALIDKAIRQARAGPISASGDRGVACARENRR